MSTRPIDHVVLPTADLAVARDRLTALGFTVAPTGVHPFGTKNACVYFDDSTFLEPLAIGDADLDAKAAASGNVFVARDRDFRAANGEEGFSALVFRSDDARTDHEEFVAEGISAGDMLTFSRPVTDAEGHTDMATFKLAFAADPLAPDTFFFTCQRKNEPRIDRSALQHHANGAIAIAAIALSAAQPDAFAPLLNVVTGTGEVMPASVDRVDTGNATLLALEPGELAEAFGTLPPDEGLRLAAIVFRVTNLGLARAVLDAQGIRFEARAGRLVVPRAPGQGAVFAFEAAA